MAQPVRSGNGGAQGGGSEGAGSGTGAGGEGAGGGVADGGQSGMKIQTDDHFAVILLHATGVIGDALLAEMSAAISAVTSAESSAREARLNTVPLPDRRLGRGEPPVHLIARLTRHGR